MENNNKRAYCPPIIDKVVLDNEISLVLNSQTPSSSPWDTQLMTPVHLKNDPFKTDMA